MCRKTLTAEIQSGTSNVSTSDPSPLPYSLSAPQPARKTQRICPMEQSNLAKFAAPSPVRLLAHLAEKKGRVHARSWWRPGRSRPMRSAERPAYGHAVRPVRGFDGDVGWKASRCAISWAPAGRRCRCRRCTATWTCVTRVAIATVAARRKRELFSLDGTARFLDPASTCGNKIAVTSGAGALSFSPMFPAIRNGRCR